VLIARALCAASGLHSKSSGAEPLLVLDEPAAGLDSTISSGLYGLLTTLNRETGTTVIMVTHDIKAAVHYANHVLYLEKDRYFFGSAAEYTAHSEAAVLPG
jgi:zinc transport system ATP-binding protein